jgi:hypothetical protein
MKIGVAPGVKYKTASTSPHRHSAKRGDGELVTRGDVLDDQSGLMREQYVDQREE